VIQFEYVYVDELVLKSVSIDLSRKVFRFERFRKVVDS